MYLGACTDNAANINVQLTCGSVAHVYVCV